MNLQVILTKGSLKRFLTLNGSHLHIDTTNPLEAENLYKTIKDQLMAKGWHIVQTQRKYIPKKTIRPPSLYVKKKILGLPYQERDRG